MKLFSFSDQYKQSFDLESKCVIFFKYIKVCEKKSTRHKTFHDLFPLLTLNIWKLQLPGIQALEVIKINLAKYPFVVHEKIINNSNFYNLKFVFNFSELEMIKTLFHIWKFVFNFSELGMIKQIILGQVSLQVFRYSLCVFNLVLDCQLPKIWCTIFFTTNILNLN